MNKKIIHKKIIDTSIIYPHSKSEIKNSLKFLTKKYLGKEIQKNTHCSKEDVEAVLDLVSLKLENGFSFGLPKINFNQNHNILTDFENNGKKCIIFDFYNNIDLISTKSSSVVPCDNHIDLHKKLLSEVTNGSHDFVYANFFNFLHLFNQNLPFGDLKKSLIDINNVLSNLFDNSKNDTLFLLYSGFGNLKNIIDSKIKYGDGSSEMNDSILKSKSSLCFISLK
jgi:hypothetical protein